jgi:hypothetical protein
MQLMAIPFLEDSWEAATPFLGTLHSLSYRGLIWAKASLNMDASAVTIGSQSLHDPRRFPAIVEVQLETTRPLGCQVRAGSVRSWPTELHKILERPLRGAEQLLALIDARGQPWAELEIGDQVHLFDPSGRERARIIRAWDPNGSRLAMRCWDESGAELAGSELVGA